MPGRSDVIGFAAIAALVAGFDQLSKAAIVAAIGPGRPNARIELGKPWIALEYAENRGVAFGLLAGIGPIVLVVSSALLAWLLVHFARDPVPPLWQTLAMGLIVGGAAGNLIDRLRLGYVVDFVAIGAWPNFNVADSAISGGVILMIWGSLFAGHGGNPAESH